MNNLESWRTMDARTRAFFVNFLKSNFMFDTWYSADLLLQNRAAQPQQLFSSMYFTNTLWEPDSDPSSVTWWEQIEGYLPTPSFYIGGWMPYLATSAILTINAQPPLQFPRFTKPARSYDTGICRRRRNL